MDSRTRPFAHSQAAQCPGGGDRPRCGSPNLVAAEEIGPRDLVNHHSEYFRGADSLGMLSCGSGVISRLWFPKSTGGTDSQRLAQTIVRNGPCPHGKDWMQGVHTNLLYVRAASMPLRVPSNLGLVSCSSGIGQPISVLVPSIIEEASCRDRPHCVRFRRGVPLP